MPLRVLSVVITLCLLLGAGRTMLAHAQSASATVYEGTQEAGGPVRAIVEVEPARVVLFEIEGVAGGGCSWDTITLANWGGELMMVDGRFEATNADGDTLTGALVGEIGTVDRRLEGTIQVRDPVRGCETPPLRWVATPMHS